MKKILIVLGLVTLCITGCGEKKDATKTLTCKKDTTVTTGVELSSTYKVSYSGKYVTKIDTTEKVTAKETSILDNYKTQLDNTYKEYRKIKGYDNTVKIDGNTLTSSTTVDYEKIDTDKLIDVDSSNSSLIKNGKIKLTDIQKVYEQLGADCK